MSRSLTPTQTMALILGMPLVLAVVYYSYLAINVARSRSESTRLNSSHELKSRMPSSA